MTKNTFNNDCEYRLHYDKKTLWKYFIPQCFLYCFKCDDLAQFMDYKSRAKFGFKPSSLGRHYITCISNIYKLFH